jgi:hypothetical protein
MEENKAQMSAGHDEAEASDGNPDGIREHFSAMGRD